MSCDLLRQRMVRNQLMPEGVEDKALLESFGTIPRECFVPPEKKDIAYQDEAIFLTKERSLMRPALLARLFGAAQFKKTDRILYLNALTGYGPAILSRLTQEVVAVEFDPFLFAEMQENQAKLKIANITPLKGDLNDNYAGPGLFDVIFIEGGVSQIPKTLEKQLCPQGFILTILVKNEGKEGHAVMLFKGKALGYYRTLFYAITPLLQSFQEKKNFIFEV